jgi:hypothetical protein
VPDIREIANLQIFNHNRTHINIIVGCGRTVNDDGSTNTIGVLSAVMAVVPACSILSCSPSVCLGLSRSKWALGDTCHSVCEAGLELTISMPVDTSSIVGKVVGNSDGNGIAPLALDGRTRNLPVDSQSRLKSAVEIDGCVRDHKVVGASISSTRPG